MSVVEKRSPSYSVDPIASDSGMSAMTSICVALVVALIVYVLGSAVYSKASSLGLRRKRAQPSKCRFTARVLHAASADASPLENGGMS